MTLSFYYIHSGNQFNIYFQGKHHSKIDANINKEQLRTSIHQEKSFKNIGNTLNVLKHSTATD